MRKLSVLLLLTLFLQSLQGSGFLLLIGGGSESDAPGAWNALPYQWAVQMSSNKRVAVLSVNNESNWIPDYFIHHCGALAARNYRIHTAALANSQATYDSLMTYDVIFLKGGDQYDYYNTWKGSLTQQALEEKYLQGGVLCGTSAGLAVLSKVLFTAEKGTVYPDEMLENPNNYYARLADDFLQFFDGHIFDSHFVDRGRLGRLAGFLAYWKLNHNALIRGLGVDENTAMAIDSNGFATVFGTGSVCLMEGLTPDPFQLNGNMLRADSLRLVQLIEGCTYDFSTGSISGFSGQVTPKTLNETGNYNLYLSGGNALSENIDMMAFFAQQIGPADSVLIITGNTQNLASDYQAHLSNLGLQNVHIRTATGSTAGDLTLHKDISQAKGFVFIDNHGYILEHFLQSGVAGEALYQRVRQDGMHIALIGDNSRFAGPVMIENYLTSNASYNGNLQLRPALRLWQTTIVMPNTYFDPDMYENAASGLPWAMVKDSAANGIWLNARSWVHYGPVQGKTWLSIHGSLPVMHLLNVGSFAGMTTATYSSAQTNSRNIVGFEQMQLSILTDGDQVMMGDHISPAGVHSADNRLAKLFLYRIGGMYYLSNEQAAALRIEWVDMQGRLCQTKQVKETRIPLPGARLPSGLYLLRVFAEDQPQPRIFKMVYE